MTTFDETWSVVLKQLSPRAKALFRSGLWGDDDVWRTYVLRTHNGQREPAFMEIQDALCAHFGILIEVVPARDPAPRTDSLSVEAWVDHIYVQFCEYALACDPFEKYHLQVGNTTQEFVDSVRVELARRGLDDRIEVRDAGRSAPTVE